MAYDFNNPTDRYNAISDLGIDGYNKAMEAFFAENTVATVNGYRIRKVGSRWGMLYMVDGANRAFKTLELARADAAKLPPAGKVGNTYEEV